MKRFITILLCCLLLAGCTHKLPADSEPFVPSTGHGTEQDDTIYTEPSPPTEITPNIPSIPTEPIPTKPIPTEPIPTEPTKPSSPTVPPLPEPNPDPLDPLEAYIQNMTLEEKVGQLFLVQCLEKDSVADIQDHHLGGYILFERDFEDETPSSVSQTNAAYQSAATVPMLIAVDEEGGNVTRVSKYPAFRTSPFLSPREIYALGGLDAIKENEGEKSQLLASLGINVNLAPVCDITTDPNAFMYPRSLGESPEITGRFANLMLQTMWYSRISGVLKHFPGYGNNTDTHEGIAIDDRSLDQLENCDLIPFQMAIDADCPAIMVSHTFINAIDSKLPATLSPKVNVYLRNEMGFDGVVITDDLVMQAITDLYGAEEAAILAVLAGNDLLCSTQYKAQYNAILEAVRNGRIPEGRIIEAVQRILIWKIQMGLLEI